MTTAPTMVHIVDDDESVRDALQVLFLSADIAAAGYGSAAGFLQAMPDLADACVITDLQMPEMDGLAFLRELIARAPHARVILITGRGDAETAQAALASGAAAYVEKPFDGERILQAVAQAVRP